MSSSSAMGSVGYLGQLGQIAEDPVNVVEGQIEVAVDASTEELRCPSIQSRTPAADYNCGAARGCNAGTAG